MRDKGRKGQISREYSREFIHRGRGEKDYFMEGRMSCEVRAEEYIRNFGRVFNEFR